MPALCLRICHVRIASSQAVLACLRLSHVLACQYVSLPLVLSRRQHNIAVLLFVFCNSSVGVSRCQALAAYRHVAVYITVF